MTKQRYNTKGLDCTDDKSYFIVGRRDEKSSDDSSSKEEGRKKRSILMINHNPRFILNQMKCQHLNKNRKMMTVLSLLFLFLQLVRQPKQSLKTIPPKQMYAMLNPTLFERNKLDEIESQKLLPFIFDEHHKPLLRDDTDSFETQNCKAMGSWQLESHPSCNLVHEIGDTDKTLLSNGSYRDTWLVFWDKSAFAMKTLVFEDDMSARNLERHKRDAVIMSMLTSSIYIPDIYAHCGDSGIFQYSSVGNMETIIRAVDKSERQQMWALKDMLRHAWQVAKALSEVHSVGNSIYQSPAIAHTDIDVDQFLWIDGMFKLNDFNRARFMRWNVVTNEPCNFFIASAPGSVRSPEEYISAFHKTQNETLSPKIDVYSLGNIFFTILTKERAFRLKSTKAAQEDVRNGRSPSIPQEVVSNFSAIEMSIYTAMKMCHIFDVHTRSTAEDVEKFLRKEMLKFEVSFFDD